MIRNISLFLLFSIFSVILLSYMYLKTSPIIEKYIAQKKEKTLKDIFPEATEFKMVSIGDITKYHVFLEDEDMGEIINVKVRGYGGLIDMLVGISADEKIRDVKVVSHRETPGLGSKVAKSPFLDQFSGLAFDDVRLKSESGHIDGVTGATISSKAIVKGVRKAFEYFER